MEALDRDEVVREAGGVLCALWEMGAVRKGKPQQVICCRAGMRLGDWLWLLMPLSVPLRVPEAQAKVATFAESSRRRKMYNWTSITSVEEICVASFSILREPVPCHTAQTWKTSTAPPKALALLYLCLQFYLFIKRKTKRLCSFNTHS